MHLPEPPALSAVLRQGARVDDRFFAPAALPLARPLTQRVPAQAVITQLLHLQKSAPPRSAPARFFGRSPLADEAAPWYRGALGELHVGRLLTKLPPGWYVLHAVPVGKGDADIDHVVVGPGGVFTLNTKNHSGQKVWVAGRTFMVNGQKQPHVRNAEHEAQRAGRLLSSAVGSPVTAIPVIAVVDPASLTEREKPATVVVLTSNQLVRWLKKRPTVLASAQVEALLTAAAHPGTWHASPPAAQDTSALQASFTTVDREVRQARSVRRLWGLGLVGAGGLTTVTVGPSLLAAFLSRLIA